MGGVVKVMTRRSVICRQPKAAIEIRVSSIQTFLFIVCTIFLPHNLTLLSYSNCILTIVASNRTSLTLFRTVVQVNQHPIRRKQYTIPTFDQILHIELTEDCLCIVTTIKTILNLKILRYIRCRENLENPIRGSPMVDTLQDQLQRFMFSSNNQW